MTKFSSWSLVVAGVCLAGTGGCTTPTDTKSTEAKSIDGGEATPPAAESEPAEDKTATKTSGAQQRTPTGQVNLHAAAARPASDTGRRAMAAPSAASRPAHAAQPTAVSADARTASASGAMAKPAATAVDAGDATSVRSERVSRAVPAASGDGRVDNAARMLQLATGEGESAG